eukprot:4108783-Pyramimonas_sp.AAC.1
MTHRVHGQVVALFSIRVHGPDSGEGSLAASLVRPGLAVWSPCPPCPAGPPGPPCPLCPPGPPGALGSPCFPCHPGPPRPPCP